MTSRQPGTAPPGTTEAGGGRAPGGRVPGGGAREGGARDRGAREGGARDGGSRDGGAQDGGAREGGARDGGARDGGSRDRSGPWPLVLPLALLIILGMAGLRGAVTQPRWNGPLHHDGLAIGLALEVVLGVLLAITIRRRAVSLRSQEVDAVAAKLRAVLIFALSGGMIAVAVVVVIGLHLHLFTRAATPPRTPPLPPHKTARPRPAQAPVAFHFPTAALLYGLLIVVLAAAVLLSIWWSRRFRVPGVPRKDDGLIAEDPEDLRQAVESGRSALRALDDARAAIIACYVAMETSLAERGAARAAADTPDELLARATKSGVVRGTAAARLTSLFYEARFSSHPLDHGQRDAAERALDELAAALSRAEPAGAGA
jgi:hypothetical protein